MAINYPLFWLIWGVDAPISFDADFFIRLSATFLCLGLVVKNYWESKHPYLFSLYWYFTVTFCLPFFFTLMTLKHHASADWLMNFMSSFFFLFFLFSFIESLIIFAFGALMGYLVFLFFYGPFYFELGTLDLYDVFFTLMAAAIIGSIFSYNREYVQQEKQRTLQMQAGAIAHEMRTPLFTLGGIGHYLKKILPSLIRDHQKLSVDQRTEVFSDKQLKYVSNTSEDIEKVTRQAFSFIDIMLMNLREDFKDAAIEDCSIKKCVEEALTEYPFGGDDRSMVTLQLDPDFEFKGNSLLIKHIFFNLLKNSIYYVKAANKGEIIIQTNVNGDHHTLSFKDTGTGIAPDILPHIFDKFYSRTKYGTGIGLAFCKAVMKGLGGDIRCTSHYGEYTEFILTFPPLVKA